ncbi:MAG TPA: hypothetical protein VI864_04495 [Candidatus Bathyarchaeia archaeon]|nr:hypothetical protein [Candidatus Bathyarchaeia archaeon]
MTVKQPSYFLVSLSNRMNLDLCIKYALAGFPNTLNGVWTFSDIRNGDYISFLYGARAHNLYRVEKKEAIRNSRNLPPWKPIEFRVSRKTYYFPFRLTLTPIRKLDEPLVRLEFAYVAENLLLRGGYRKTHFQGDQTTLQNISQMGSLHGQAEKLEMQGYETFIPKFIRNRKLASPPEVYPLQEMVLQAAIRQFLSENRNIDSLLKLVGVCDLDVEKLEVLGEKALPEGHVDILIKEAIPIGLSKKVVVEVKMAKAHDKDIEQLEKYVVELETECVGGILIAKEFPQKIIQKSGKRDGVGLNLVKYILSDFSPDDSYTFEQLKEKIRLDTVK